MKRVYAYKNCSTCRKALSWLSENGIDYELLEIRETPPSEAELTTAMKYFSGDSRRLFNSSGTDYRDLGMKNRLSGMSETEVITLLATNGNLVKRPFLIGDGKVITGFKAEAWASALL
jgi:arsenate reductase (glutaredoxin)